MIEDMCIEGQDIAYKIVSLDEVTSTNDYAKDLARQGAAHGTVIVARSQTAGRGRLGRSFESESGKGLYMTIILRPQIETGSVSQLTIVAAMAVKRALERITGENLGIKWPNDIVKDGKKVSGILTEMAVEQNTIKYVVVGIGVNVNNYGFADELRDVAISMSMIAGREYDIEDIAKEVLIDFDAYFHDYMTKMDLGNVQDEYNGALVHKDKRVYILNGNTTSEGMCIGMDDTGALLVETEKGLEKIISGEISVRGVYGYV